MAFALAGCDSRSATSGSGKSAKDGPRPNIVFLLIDALRADRLGAYGHDGDLTPTMDALAAEGAAFDRAIAQASWTQPSVASPFSSYYPSVHKVISYQKALEGRVSGGAKARIFGENFTTLAEVLQTHGYATAAFTTNAFVLPKLGFGQGFDHFDATLIRKPGNVLNDAALAWLEERDRSKPFFVYLHYMDAHGPDDAAPEFLEPLLDAVEKIPTKRKLTMKELIALNYLRGLPSDVRDPTRHRQLMQYREYWVARYEAGVRQADHHLAALVARLRRMELWDNTYVILTADHGEALCEHGIWGHGLSVHHNQLRVPLILRWPGVVPAGQHVGGTVRLIDVMPTILDQLRLPPLEGVQGVSVVPYLIGQTPPQPALALGEAVKQGTEQKALYRGDWKLIQMESDPQRHWLYNIARDPDEQTNLAQQNAEEFTSLLEALRRQRAENERLATQVKIADTPVSEEWRRQLEALGYVGEGDTGDSPPPP